MEINESATLRSELDIAMRVSYGDDFYTLRVLSTEFDDTLRAFWQVPSCYHMQRLVAIWTRVYQALRKFGENNNAA